MLSEGSDAEDAFRKAIERLGRARVRAECARAQLLYGEWLRRAGRRVDARRELNAAFETFSKLGMAAFAERSRRELGASGEHARKRTVETREELTPQETQIALLARDGLSNPEIAARLYISSRTVEWHLRKVFTKLGIKSRMRLGTALADAGLSVASA
jgi:DNA-binding NarL/FixJ family response regulator